LNPATERKGVEAQSVEISTREKTDAKASETWAVIRPGKDPKLCPLTHYQAVRNGAKRRGLRDALWCTEKGVPFKRTGPILDRMKELLAKAGIPKEYGAYSIRHATITALMNLMKRDDKKVAAFTGHSTKAETVNRFYYHLDKNHASQALSAITATGTGMVAVNEQVAGAIQDDDQDEENDEDGQGDEE
jgi:site-specific recombinase XerC